MFSFFNCIIFELYFSELILCLNVGAWMRFQRAPPAGSRRKSSAQIRALPSFRGNEKPAGAKGARDLRRQVPLGALVLQGNRHLRTQRRTTRTPQGRKGAHRADAEIGQNS